MRAVPSDFLSDDAITVDSYRYWQRRHVQSHGDRWLFVTLHPTSTFGDLAFHQCLSIAQENGAGMVGIISLFAHLTDDTPDLWADATVDPQGPLSDEFLATAGRWADKIIFAFGAPPEGCPDWFEELWTQRVASVTQQAEEFGTPKALALTDEGWPAQVNLLPRTTKLKAWRHP